MSSNSSSSSKPTAGACVLSPTRAAPSAKRAAWVNQSRAVGSARRCSVHSSMCTTAAAEGRSRRRAVAAMACDAWVRAGTAAWQPMWPRERIRVSRCQPRSAAASWTALGAEYPVQDTCSR